MDAAIVVQAGRFAMVGMINTAIDLVLFWLLGVALGLPYLTANGLSYGAGMASSYLLNRAWTFRANALAGPVRRQVPRLLAINLASLAASSMLLSLLVEGLGLFTAKLFALSASVAMNFIGSRYFVFR